jgi:hypothetical protein
VAVRVEISVFVAFVFVGAGSRPWHLLHSFVALVFAALFSSARAAKVVGTSIAGALLLQYLVLAVWPDAPIERQFGVLAPIAIVAATTFLLVYVRRMVDDAETVVQAERRAALAVAAARHRLASQAALVAVRQPIAERLAVLAATLRRPVLSTDPLSPAARSHCEALGACLDAIDETIGELGASEQDASGYFSGRAEVVRAARRAAGMGGDTRVDVSGSLALEGSERHAFRRIVDELLANALKHSWDRVAVSLQDVPARTLDVVNAGDRVPASRPGGLGLAAVRRDAAVLGGTVHWTSSDGRITTTVALPEPPSTPGPSGASGVDELRSRLAQRSRSYLHGVLVTRVVLSLLAIVTIETGRAQHRSLLPSLTASAIALLVVNVLLLTREPAVEWALLRRPGVVWVDALVMAALIATESGMASPWMPLSMGTLLLVGLVRGPRDAALVAAFFSAAMLGGYELVRALGLDDLGTRAQDMPVQWFWNSFVYAAIAVATGAVGWAFDRTAEAIRAYERAAATQFETERLAAIAEARAETQRQLHASLQQYVGAAQLRLELIRRVAPDAAELDGFDERLATMRDAVGDILLRLGTAAAPR